MLRMTSIRLTSAPIEHGHDYRDIVVTRRCDFQGFRPEALIRSFPDGDKFELVDVRIHGVSQLDRAPYRNEHGFNRCGLRFPMDVVKHGEEIEVVVHRIYMGPPVFDCVLVGIAPDDGDIVINGWILEMCRDHYHCRSRELACVRHRIACSVSGLVTSALPCPSCGESSVEGSS